MADHCSDPNPGFYQNRQFHRWPSLRAFFGMMIPCCGCHTISSTRPFLMSSTVTGTIFGQRKGRVSFCVQEDPCSPPILLLEWAISTNLLVKEMQSGILRITLECEKREKLSLLEEPVWRMYCNGRKAGYARKKEKKDAETWDVMKVMESVTTGGGVIPRKIWSRNGERNNGEEQGKAEDDEVIIYMRASYERIVGSSDSESFHMLSPHGCLSQDLSIFLHRS